MDDTPKNPTAPGTGKAPAWPSLGAWQPFTGSGLRAFAGAPAWKAGAWLLVASCLTGLALAWLLRATWWPVVAAAAEAFPDSTVELRHGSLGWKAAQSMILAEAPRFAIALRTDAPATTGRIADLQLELWPTECRISGIAGFVAFPWPPTWNLSLDRRDAVAGWGAWKRPLLLAAAIAGSVANAIVAFAWCLILAVPLWILGWILGRGLPLGSACKLALASTAPPSLGAAVAILGYGLHWIAWPFLLAALGCHPLFTLLLGTWAVLEMKAGSAAPNRSPAARPGGKPRPGANPFAAKKPAKSGDSDDGHGKGGRGSSPNPFRR